MQLNPAPFLKKCGENGHPAQGLETAAEKTPKQNRPCARQGRFCFS